MADELTARIRMIEGTTSLGEARTHSITVDRPLAKGGKDLGFLGGELLLVAEGGCLMSNLAAAAQARGVTLTRAEFTVRASQETTPARFGEIVVEADLEAPGQSDQDLDKLLLIAERGCIVSNTLRDATRLTVTRRARAASQA